jgi:hypothetical protein
MPIPADKSQGLVSPPRYVASHIACVHQSFQKIMPCSISTTVCRSLDMRRALRVHIQGATGEKQIRRTDPCRLTIQAPHSQSAGWRLNLLQFLPGNVVHQSFLTTHQPALMACTAFDRRALKVVNPVRTGMVSSQPSLTLDQIRRSLAIVTHHTKTLKNIVIVDHRNWFQLSVCHLRQSVTRSSTGKPVFFCRPHI